MEGLGLPHLLLIAVIFLVFFGPKRLPQLGQSLGKAIKGFKQGLSEIEVEATEIKDQPGQANPQASTQLNQQSQKTEAQLQAEKADSTRKTEHS